MVTAIATEATGHHIVGTPVITVAIQVLGTGDMAQITGVEDSGREVRVDSGPGAVVDSGPEAAEGRLEIPAGRLFLIPGSGDYQIPDPGWQGSG